MMRPNPWKWCTRREGVLICLLFDREIVNNEGEDCCARFVSPEAWSVLHRVIAEVVKVFGKFHVGDDTCLL